MPKLSASELYDAMRGCVGSDEAAVLDNADLPGITFEDLDFDSLAKVELAARLADQYGIDIPDDELDQLSGPADVLDYINARIAS